MNHKNMLQVVQQIHSLDLLKVFKTKKYFGVELQALVVVVEVPVVELVVMKDIL